MKLKFTFLIFILFSCVFFLTGCYTSKGIENKAYVVALGIDVGEKNTLKISMQASILNNANGNSQSGSSNKSTTVLSVDCSSIDSGIALINSYISKKIDLTHCKAIVFSEEIAYAGLADVLYTLVNNIEIRPDCNVVVSKCSAYDFLSNSVPIFESSPANYYELILNSSEYSGYVADLYLSNFYLNMLNSTNQACAILGNINTDDSHASTDYTTSSSLDGNYTAGQTPIKSKNRVENMGTAVFVGDKVVGELTNIETLCHLIVTNNLENATITVPNPFNFDSTISVYIKSNKPVEKKLYFYNGYPYITCEVYVSGNILSLSESVNISNEQDLQTINSYVNKYLEDSLSEYLYKTSKVFKSDIAGFGKYALLYYSTWNDWIDSDWLNNYQNSFFNVVVHTELQSGYLFNRL